MAGYTRQDTQNNISNGSVIDADDLDAEFNTLEAGFNSSTGHSHDGTVGSGAPITTVGPSQDVIISSTQVLPKVDNTLDLGSNTVRFKAAYFDGPIANAGLTSTGTFTSSGLSSTESLSVSNAASIGGTLSVTGVVIASAGVTGDVTGDVTGTVSDVSNHDTDDIAEGSNLYFTTARARAAISATGNLSYNSTTGVISFTQGNTDTVNEGSTNLYYTNARARAAMAVVDAGGDGSLSYNSSTGVITYTGPSAAEVRAHLSAGTGVTYSSGQFSIGQPVGTSSNVTFGNVTVSGDLTVSGTTTYINTQTLNIGDNIITLNADETGTPSADAGIEVERGTSANKSLFWDESEDEWTVGSERFKAGTFEGDLTGAVTGNATTATTLQTARTIALGGDLSGSASFNGSSNITITATIADDSHNHVIANVDGLQTALDAKADDTTTISAGAGLTGGGSLGASRTISHADTSSQGSINNSGNTVIQDITLDTYGHITSIGSTTIDPPTAFGVVGTYIWGRPQNDTNYAPGDTASGLYAISYGDYSQAARWDSLYNTWDYTYSETAVSGTWRCMTGANNTNTYFNYIGLWVRIS